MRKTLAAVLLAALFGATVAAGCARQATPTTYLPTATYIPVATATPTHEPTLTPPPSERLSINQTVDGYHVPYSKSGVDGALSISIPANRVQLSVYRGRSSQIPDTAWSSCSPSVQKFTGSPGSPILTSEEAPDLAAKVNTYLTSLFEWVGLQPDCTIKR